MLTRCRFTIPKTTWAYIAILAVVVVGAIMREINLLIILAGLMGGPLLMSWQLIRLTLRQLTVTRRVPAAVFPGQTFVVEFTVRNPRKRLDSWALVIEDRLRNLLTGRDTEIKTARCLLPYVASGCSAHTHYRARLWQRGRYRFGPLWVSTKVPMGLLKGRVALKETSDVIVFPSLGHLKTGWSDLVKYEQMGQRSWQQRQGSVEGDFYGLRDWRAGDSRRWIHWRSSAKRQDLVVRQFEQHRSQDTIILLDLIRDPSSDADVVEQAERIEKAISFTATIVSDLCGRGGGRLTLGVAGQTPRLLRGTASSALLNDALELLAEAAVTDRDTVSALLPELFVGTSSGDRILVIALRPTDVTRDPRFAAAQQEDRRRARLEQTLCVDVSQPEFGELFDWDGSPEVHQSEVD